MIQKKNGAAWRISLYLELSAESLALGLVANGLGSDVDMMFSDGGPLATGSCLLTGEPRRKLGLGPISGLGSIEARCLGGTSFDIGRSANATADPLTSGLGFGSISGDISVAADTWVSDVSVAASITFRKRAVSLEGSTIMG